jgi:hypothetical protein
VAAFTIPHGKGRSMEQVTLANPHWATMKRFLECQAMAAGRKHLADL